MFSVAAYKMLGWTIRIINRLFQKLRIDYNLLNLVNGHQFINDAAVIYV